MATGTGKERCGEQISIFDFFKEAEKAQADKVVKGRAITPLDNITEGEMIKQISKATGLKFEVDNRFADIYAPHKNYIAHPAKKHDITVHYSKYSCDGVKGSNQREGRRYIAVDYSKNYGDYHGFGCPCDSIEQAIKRVKEGIELASRAERKTA